MSEWNFKNCCVEPAWTMTENKHHCLNCGKTLIDVVSEMLVEKYKASNGSATHPLGGFDAGQPMGILSVPDYDLFDERTWRQSADPANLDWRRVFG